MQSFNLALSLYPQTACILRFQDMHCAHLGELFAQTDVVPTDAGHFE